MTVMLERNLVSRRLLVKKVCILAIVAVASSIVTGCRSYRYTGFDAVPQSYPRDVRLFVTNLVLKVEPSLKWSSVSISESFPYESHSPLQMAKAGGEERLMSLLNERLAECSDDTATNILASVMIDSPEVDVTRNYLGYVLTLSLIFPAEQVVDERSVVRLYADNRSCTGTIHVRGEGRGTVFSPWALFVPDEHPDAVFTQATNATIAPAWGLLSPFFSATNPGNDVLVCDLANALLIAYHSKEKGHVYADE